MRKTLLWTTLTLTSIATLQFVVAQQPTQSSPSPAQNKPAPSTAHQATPPESDGERVFEQNCSRCHTAPDGFSPRISGTVARHMRVRASLSKQDEQALLKFLNP